VAFFAVIYAQKKVILPGNHQPAMLELLSSEFDLLINDKLLEESIKNSITGKSCFSFFTLDLDCVELVLFTSGTTGVPKAVNKTLLMLDQEIQGLECQFGALLYNSAVVSTVSHQHIYGLLFRILWPLCAARPFAATDIIYPEQVLENAIKEKVLISSPALLKRLDKQASVEGYCAVFSSGGPLANDAADLSKRVLKTFVIEVFGSTETGGIGFREQKSSQTPWTFFDEVDAKLTIDNCLALTSPWLSKPFINSDDGYYQTSDQCDLVGNNQFRLKGRIDQIVKIEEKRVSLAEVEMHLNELEWIAESVVIVISDPQRVALGALLKLTAIGEQELATLGKGKFWIKLRQSLRNWVEPVAIPRYFRIASEIPMNKQGKRLLRDIVGLFE
jgi:acyl-coenzyme A synthetase/AMP-(fatty) acid ligase